MGQGSRQGNRVRKKGSFIHHGAAFWPSLCGDGLKASLGESPPQEILQTCECFTSQQVARKLNLPSSGKDKPFPSSAPFVTWVASYPIARKT